MISAKEFYGCWAQHIKLGERRGQALVNTLADLDYGLFKSIDETDADCFYDDRKIPAFKEKIAGHMDWTTLN